MTAAQERPTEQATKRAAIYLRQSSDPSGMQFGVDRQHDEILRYIQARGWEPVLPPFTDNDTSAYKLSKPRPQFNDMMRRAEKGEFDFIVARHLDRLTRRLEEFASIKRRSQDAGVALITTADGVDTSTDGGRMLAGILAVIAEGEMERKSYRHLSANKQRAEKGKGWGPRAFGYNGEHDNPELVHDEAAAVRSAYHALLAGDSVYSIALNWNRAGFRTNQGNEWDTTQVKRLLLNPRYAGLRAYRREILYKDGVAVKADWPAIVDENTWQAVHYLLTSRKGVRNARKYLLGGILACGECGEPMYSGYTTDPRKAATEEDRPTYRCKKYTCARIQRRQRMVDPWVENTILNRILQKGWKLVSDVDPGQLEALHNDATALRTRKDALGGEFAAGNLTAGQVRVATEALDAQLREVEAQLAQVAKSEVLDGLIGADDLLERWEGLGLDRKRAVIRALVDKIEVQRMGVKGRAANKVPMGYGIKIHWRKPDHA
jgi:DNA invertase Pin-like site-specific DNA recombinase